MNFTIEGLSLAMLFIVPGFLFWQTSGLRRKVGDLTLTLFSTAIAGALLAVEGLIVVGIFAPLVGAVDEALARFLEVGLLDYARERPKMVSAFVLGLPLLNSGILLGAGYLDKKRSKRSNSPPIDLWPWIQEKGPVRAQPASGYTKVATARLKTGVSYKGILANVALKQTDEGNREFVLWQVWIQNAGQTSWAKLVEDELSGKVGSMIVLQTKECASIELSYHPRKKLSTA